MGLFSFVKSQLLKIVEWTDDSKDTLVYRFPMDGKQLMTGSKLTVRDGQVAIFVHKGTIADIFEPGYYSLKTELLPVLSKLMGWAYGFNAPFSCEVYFVNTTQFTNQKWGTSNPITMRDADFGTIRIKGYGTYAFKVGDPKTFLEQLFGTNSTFKTEDINEYLKSMLVAGISDSIAESKISALDLSANLLEFNQIATDQIGGKFDELGLKLTNLVIENISFPEEVEKAIDTRSSLGVMGDKMGTFVQYQAAQAMRDAAQNQGNPMASAGVSLGSGIELGKMMSNALKDAKDEDKPKSNVGFAFCPECGTKCESNAKFCSNCGHKFENQGAICPKCGEKIENGTKFCPNCGAKL
jgi:membrane protease subunit (stomatin/prohibitin family)